MFFSIETRGIALKLEPNFVSAGHLLPMYTYSGNLQKMRIPSMQWNDDCSIILLVLSFCIQFPFTVDMRRHVMCSPHSVFDWLWLASQRQSELVIKRFGSQSV